MSEHESQHDDSLPDDVVKIAADSGWRRLPAGAAFVGILTLGAAFALKGEGESAQQFYVAYLTAFMSFLALGLGGLFFVLIQHVVRAGWSISCRRLAENMALTLPLLGLLSLPMVFGGTHELFHWAHEGAVQHDAVLAAKAAYLNETAFTIRAFVYIVIWTLLGVGFWRWSILQDTAADPARYSLKARFWSPVALPLFGLSLTFAAFDWLMSLDPHWFSTIFGVYYFAGAVISVHAFIALIVMLLHRSGHLHGVVTTEHFHDLGKMVFAFTVFWAYIGFSQYMLIWYASIPEETEWYAYRGHGQWLVLSLVLVFTRFVFPFLGIMSRRIKRYVPTFMFWAIWVLVAEVIDMYWLVHPVFAHAHHQDQLGLNAFDLLAVLGIGGLWLAVFGWALVRYPLVPLQDPRLQESIHFENF